MFRDVFKAHRRLDFVHANAGIIEKGDFYGHNDTGDEPPPAFPSLTVDIDLFSVVQTSYLALHYMRQAGKDVSRSIVVTASCGGLYAVPNAPTYAASKFGAVGWTRSIAGRLWYEDGIRVNVSVNSAFNSKYDPLISQRSAFALALSAQIFSPTSNGRTFPQTTSRPWKRLSKLS